MAAAERTRADAQKEVAKTKERAQRAYQLLPVMNHDSIEQFIRGKIADGDGRRLRGISRAVAAHAFLYADVAAQTWQPSPMPRRKIFGYNPKYPIVRGWIISVSRSSGDSSAGYTPSPMSFTMFVLTTEGHEYLLSKVAGDSPWDISPVSLDPTIEIGEAAENCLRVMQILISQGVPPKDRSDRLNAHTKALTVDSCRYSARHSW